MEASDGTPAPPPEAVLLGRARQARGLTRDEAARRSGVVKAARWGQIENGYLMKAGRAVATKAGHMQLAHMAHAVGISSDRLAETGRETAADILREIERQAEQAQSYANPADPLEQAVWQMPASEADRRLLIDALRKRRAEDAAGERGRTAS